MHNQHLATVKHIFRYIVGTVNYGLVYPQALQHRQQADRLHAHQVHGQQLGGDIDERKIICSVGGHYRHQKQKMVALSTCEAKYMVGMARAC